MKRVNFPVTALSAALYLVFSSCSSTDVVETRYLPDTAPLAVNNEKDAQVVVTRLDNEGGYIGIYIDAVYAGKLGNGGNGFYKVIGGGVHKITAKYDEYTRFRDGDVWSGVLTAPEEFVSGDTARHYFVKYTGREGYSRYLVELTRDDNSMADTVRSSSGPMAAVHETFKTIAKNIPADTKIAIVNIVSDNAGESGYLIDELTVLFVDEKYFVVDRNRLQAIMNEQQFQMSGYVDDNSIVSIGHFAGANVVLTGNINTVNGKKRLVFRALDVLTSRILAMSSVNL